MLRDPILAAQDGGVRLGRVVAAEADGSCRVELRGKGSLRCRSLSNAGSSVLGDQVAVVMVEETPGEGLILGVVGAPAAGREPRQNSVRAGRLTRRDEQGLRATLSGDGQEFRVVPPRHWSPSTVDALITARELVLFDVDESSETPTLRLLGLPAIAPTTGAGWEATRIVLEGREEIVLRAGRARLVLRANGDIELLGDRVVSRARKQQKLLAPMLKLN